MPCGAGGTVFSANADDDPGMSDGTLCTSQYCSNWALEYFLLGIKNNLAESPLVSWLEQKHTQIHHNPEYEYGPGHEYVVEVSNGQRLLAGATMAVPVLLEGRGLLAARAVGEGTVLTPEAAALEEYGGVGGGHHVPARSAFRGDAVYNPNRAPAIPNSELARLGVSHSAVTGAQMTGYRALAQSGVPLTWDSVAAVETNALVTGGMTREMAQATVNSAIQTLQSQGVIAPTRIPWGP